MEELKIINGNKAEMYDGVIPQIESVIGSEEFLLPKMSNICAILKEIFNFWWVGFYLTDEFVKNGLVIPDNIKEISERSSLILGPFQGPLACQRIKYGRGVCGTAWKEQKTIIVDDVNMFPGHIACSSLSRSEIVIPVFALFNGKRGEIIGVLDIDSKDLCTFDDTDKKYLEQIVKMI